MYFSGLNFNPNSMVISVLDGLLEKMAQFNVHVLFFAPVCL
jgi:hypothetical protein